MFFICFSLPCHFEKNSGTTALFCHSVRDPGGTQWHGPTNEKHTQHLIGPECHRVLITLTTNYQLPDGSKWPPTHQMCRGIAETGVEHVFK